MKKEKESKIENDQESLQLERYIQKKKEESEILQKLLKQLQKEQVKNQDSK